MTTVSLCAGHVGNENMRSVRVGLDYITTKEVTPSIFANTTKFAMSSAFIFLIKILAHQCIFRYSSKTAAVTILHLYDSERSRSVILATTTDSLMPSDSCVTERVLNRVISLKVMSETRLFICTPLWVEYTQIHTHTYTHTGIHTSE